MVTLFFRIDWRERGERVIEEETRNKRGRRGGFKCEQRVRE